MISTPCSLKNELKSKYPSAVYSLDNQFSNWDSNNFSTDLTDFHLVDRDKKYLDRLTSPPVLFRQEIGEVFRTLRLNQKQSLAQVANKSGLSVSYLSEIERGKKEVSSELMSSICEALGKPIGIVLHMVADASLKKNVYSKKGNINAPEISLADEIFEFDRSYGSDNVMFLHIDKHRSIYSLGL